MREILFRGKRIDNGEWVEGLYTENCISYASGCAIIEDYFEKYDVKRDTVDQYTGMIDKNGKRIFEGDIIRCGGKVVGVVNYHDYCFCVRFIMKDHANRSNPAMDIIENEYPNDIEVIGNVHDNPELITEVEGC